MIRRISRRRGTDIGAIPGGERRGKASIETRLNPRFSPPLLLGRPFNEGKGSLFKESVTLSCLHTGSSSSMASVVFLYLYPASRHVKYPTGFQTLSFFFKFLYCIAYVYHYYYHYWLLEGKEMNREFFSSNFFHFSTRSNILIQIPRILFIHLRKISFFS